MINAQREALVADNRLAVVLYGEVVGYLNRLDGDAVSFEYDADYTQDTAATPLSLSMPLRQQVHPPEAVKNWVEGLLPDDDVLRAVWARSVDLSPDSPVFDWLASPLGLDCAGAVQFVDPAGSTERAAKDEAISDAEIEEWLTELLRAARRGRTGRSVTAGSFSVSGAQVKLALRNVGRGWSKPSGPLPTTHLLKPSVPGFRNQAVIEHLCMAAAAGIGLSASKTSIVSFGGIDTIVVERFDREDGPDGSPKTKRIHGEDLCQALGVSADKKYQVDGGPSPGDIATLLTENATESLDAVRIFSEMTAYNFIVLNSDAHAKNYGVTLAGAYVGLSPLYDVCSLTPWPDDNPSKPELAMLIGGASDYHSVHAETPAAWVECGRQMGINGKALALRVGEMAAAVPDALTAAVEELPDRLAGTAEVERLVEALTPRCRKLADEFAGSASSPK
ncbi:MAG TPA: hypothetical protein DEP66_06710 [Acidimicrobiaceae bacterium]|nr:hypothetical protein [Acidimicrobiaceae bacterium]HCB37875.1 hypothetical protein [Acidimicrobiaceae bacterium]